MGDSGTGDSSTADASSSGGDAGGDGGGATLTVKNYLSWCSISINGGTASTNPVLTLDNASGSVTLAASAASGFELDPNGTWHDVSAAGSTDMGTISGGTSTVMVTVSGTSKCVWACCPGTGGSPPCPTTDQCP